MHQLRVALQCFDHLVGVLPRLLQWAGNGLGARIAVDFPGLLVGADEGGEAKVFDFQNQDAPARVHDHKVWVLVFGADGHVVPQQVIGIELELQPLAHASLPARHTRNATPQCWYQCCHAL